MPMANGDLYLMYIISRMQSSSILGPRISCNARFVVKRMFTIDPHRSPEGRDVLMTPVDTLRATVENGDQGERQQAAEEGEE